MILSEIIKNYRHINHLTMQEFADRCGLSKGYISMLEKGKHPQNSRRLMPSIPTLAKIANAMNTDIDTFINVLDLDTIVTVNVDPDDIPFNPPDEIADLWNAWDQVTPEDKAIIKIIAAKYKGISDNG